MENKDSIHLLRECDAGTKMAVTSIDEVLEYTKHPDLVELLTKSKSNHEKIGNEIHSLLLEYGSDEKEPAAVAKGMSWLKTNMKMTFNGDDTTVAHLITDGCDMGINSLYGYKNEYACANEKVKDLCDKLIEIEDELRRDLRRFL